MFRVLKIERIFALILSLMLGFAYPLTVDAVASFEKTGQGDEVPNYVRADITFCLIDVLSSK